MLVTNQWFATPQERIGTKPDGYARPVPILNARDQLGPYRIALDVAKPCGEMLVILDGEENGDLARLKQKRETT